MEEIVATVLFANLINPPKMGENPTILQYEEMLRDFQNTMYEVISHHLEFFGYEGIGVDHELCIMGDEIRVFLYSGQVQFDIRNALLIAIKIKLAWLVSTFNQGMGDEKGQLSSIGVGIDCGKVVKDLRTWQVRMGHIHPNIEGYIISQTKHIQLGSQEGTVSQIMVGANFYERCRLNTRINIAFSPQKILNVRGLDQRIPAYEVFSFVNFEIISSMPPPYQEGLLEKIESIIYKRIPKPWIFVILLRSYISTLAMGDDEHLSSKAVELAQQALKVLDYKVVIYNMLGWLYNNCKSIRSKDIP